MSRAAWITQYGRDRIDRFKLAMKLETHAQVADELGISEELFSKYYHAHEPVHPHVTTKLKELLSIWEFEHERMYCAEQDLAQKRGPLA